MIKVATFDVDGTLMRRYEDVYTLKIEAIDHAVRQTYGLGEFRYHNYLKPSMYGMTDRSILRHLLLMVGIDESELDSKFEKLFQNIFTYFDSHPEHTTDKDYYLLPGVVEILKLLKSRNIAMGLATGNYLRFTEWKVGGLGLWDYFTFGGYGNDADDRADIVGVALNRSGGESGHAIHFGDTVADIEAAHANNMLAGVVTSKGGAIFDSAMLKDAGADLIIDSWQDTESIMRFLENHSG